MKLNVIADKALKSMVELYHQSGKEIFMNEYFVELFPDEPHEHINNALCTLKDDGLIKISFMDGIPYCVSLIPSGIRECEEDTLIKKGYHCLKEIRQLIG